MNPKSAMEKEFFNLMAQSWYAKIGKTACMQDP